MSKNTTRVAPLLGLGKSKSNSYTVRWIDYGNPTWDGKKVFTNRKTAVNFAVRKLLKKNDMVMVVVE